MQKNQSFLRIFRLCTFLLVTCLSAHAVSGCAKTPTPSRSEFQTAQLELSKLVDRHGQVETPLTRDYLRYLASRLSLNSNTDGMFSVTLLGTATPLAYSPGGRELILSQGLVHATRTEAELAFVIAHEMSHEILGHLSQVHRQFPDGSAESKKRKVLEIAADRHALKLLTLAGYDPRASAHGLFNVYEAAGLTRTNSTHPEVEERVRIMLTDVLKSRWRPPGTVDRREFQRFRREVLKKH